MANGIDWLEAQAVAAVVVILADASEPTPIKRTSSGEAHAEGLSCLFRKNDEPT
jgi:hypothetical protein